MVRQRQHLVQNVALIGKMPKDAIARPTPIAIEGLVVDAVDAEELQPAHLQMVPQGINHTHVLVIVETADPGGKHQDAGAGMAEHQHFHIPRQVVAIPLMVFAPEDRGRLHAVKHRTAFAFIDNFI